MTKSREKDIHCVAGFVGTSRDIMRHIPSVDEAYLAQVERGAASIESPELVANFFRRISMKVMLDTYHGHVDWTKHDHKRAIAPPESYQFCEPAIVDLLAKDGLSALLELRSRYSNPKIQSIVDTCIHELEARQIQYIFKHCQDDETKIYEDPRLQVLVPSYVAMMMLLDGR
ncbi:MAG TPA: hypothetical protein VJB60_02940 [Candidatus Peribacterales bacterium]|nr:hypothetical protein [Candidatus Peribacterales bacterium]